MPGRPLVVSLAAANTDPALTADRRAGNRAYLAWSAGPHTCPAQRPARRIAAVAVEKLLDRLPDVGLAVPADELKWRPGPFHRTLVALPVTFPPGVVGRSAPDGEQPADLVAVPAAAPQVVPPRVRPARQGWAARLRSWWRGD